MRRTAIVAALFFAPALALAASHSGDQRTITSVSVTNSSAQAIGVSAGPRLFLSIDNESATANIACNFGGTAALNTAGSYTIAAGTTRTWGPVNKDNPLSGAAINCISSAASSPATIESWP
jgi:hypothetical protein